MKVSVENYLSLPVVQEGFSFLEKNLPSTLHYHSVEHTREVLIDVLELAEFANLEEPKSFLLSVAAVLHDTGYFLGSNEHEKRSVGIAREIMEKSGDFDSRQIEEVLNCILSTELKVDLTREPKTELSRYLLDADLASFGKEGLENKIELLSLERGVEKEEILEETKVLMDKHVWFTDAAVKLFQAGKERNQLLLLEV